MDRLLVILDLDETLVHASERRLSRHADVTVGPYHVYQRPFLSEFLRSLRERYAIAIWTAAGQDYAEPVIAHITPGWRDELAFVWCAERCTAHFDHETRDRNTIKKLGKVRHRGYDLDRVLVVDDSPEKHVKNYGNLVQIRPFYGELGDAELPAILEFIHSLADAPNVRAIEKRYWRGRS
jgi:RNA polymerase II subunit A small phosphatase-like protein